ncbi:MAG TPA: DUF4442 domain-containing protein [Longimicrobiales bacterium]|nr:DUF4442 domain-containing protein [Longimicrobiales bacterium]
MPTPAARLASAWTTLSRLPAGPRLFDLLIRLMVPYSGSIRPRVVRLEPGHATVDLRDRRRLRNHLRSVHAIALANLGELASGLAMTRALPPDVRGIPVRIEIEYLKKARGRIRAEGRATPPRAVEDETEAHASAELFDPDGELVARMTVLWRLRPA